MYSGNNENETTLYDLFHRSCLNYPNNIAVLYNCGTSTLVLKYVDLIVEVKKLSEHLRRTCVDCAYIGICISNPRVAPVIILGVLGARKAYVVVQQGGVAQDLLSRLGCAWVLAELGCWEAAGCELCAQWEVQGIWLCLWSVLGVAPRMVSEVRLAYAVQTSGSTGQPVTIQVPHAAVLPNIIDLQHMLRVVPGDVVFLAAPLTFDPSVVEMFLALGSGATLLVVGPGVCASPQLLLHCLFPSEGRTVTVLQVTPSVLGHWLGAGVLPRGLRALLLGGEPCPALAVLKKWMGGHTDCRIFNMYGLTEVSCWASVQELSWDAHEAEVPLGSPLSHTLLSIRDQSGRSVTHGEGEMFVGSLERTCFVGHEELKIPTVPVFRATGDIVKVDGESGAILYVGRSNSLVKRWGHRVDVAAVEREVRGWRASMQCRCVWDQQSSTLGLFLVGSSAQEQLLSQVRWHLVRHLSPPAMPDVFELLQSWPLTAHGKLDDAALKRLLRMHRASSAEGGSKSCKHSLEVMFTRLWHKYLGPREPHAPDSFILAGGTSFLAVQMSIELQQLCGRLPLPQLIPMLLTGSTFLECRRYLAQAHSSSAGGIHQSTSCVETSPAGRNALVEPVSQRTVACEAKDCDLLDTLWICGPQRSSVEDFPGHAAKVHVQLDEPGSRDTLCASSCRGRMTRYCEDLILKRQTVTSSQLALHVLWKSSLGKCVDASPVVALFSSGKVLVVVGSHSHKLVAFDGETGQMLWQISLPDRIESSVCLSPCGTFGVVGCYDGSVYCMSMDSGAECWRFHTGHMVKSSPSLCRGGLAIVVGSYDHHLYCLRLQDGGEYWRVRLGGGVLTSPLLEQHSGLVVAAALDGTCVALAQEDGRLHWERRLATPVFSSPAVLPGGRVLFVEVTGTLHCLLVASGEQVWTLALAGQVFSSPSILEDGALLLGCHDTCVYCVEETGAVRWRATLGSAVVATPCTLSPDLAVVATTCGSVHLLSLSTGAQQGYLRLPDEVFSSPASVNPQHMYLGCRDDHLYCLTIH